MSFMKFGTGTDPIERAGLDQLRILQFERLTSVVRRVYEGVPHYRKKFEAAGVHPDDLREFADIEKLPFTTKDDLRENYPFGMFAAPMGEIVRLHASSGTTGKPTVVGYTQTDIDIWATLMARSIRVAGGRPEHKIHIAFGYGLFTGGLGFHYGAERLGAAVIPVSGGMTERQVQLIADFRPDIICVTPSYLLVIADELERQGLDPRKTSLRFAICGAEPWSEAMRAEIESRFGIPALDSYGLSEVIGPGVAQECADSKGALTIWEDHFWPEIIDPESGCALEDGESGELVLTTLTKEGMPVIRYRTRDQTRLLPGVGRSMRRLERVSGRTDDMLIVRGVNVFPSQIESVLMQEPVLAPHYLLEIRREGRLDKLDVCIEHRGASLSSTERAGLERRAERLLKAHIGLSAKVRVMDAGVIERSQGKAKRVRDLRPKA